VCVVGFVHPKLATERGDWQQEGPFAGRGPKGYQRSDSRIREDVSDRLTDAPDIDAGAIEANVNYGEVTLSGTVRHRHEKRRTEDVTDSVTGGHWCTGRTQQTCGSVVGRKAQRVDATSPRDA
jgi:hypothetical protein